MKYLILQWAPYCRRSQSLAAELGTEAALIHYFKFQMPKYALLKYPLQFLKTLYILAKKRPHIVIAVAPPIFCPLTAFLFCLLFKRKLVIDAHTGAVIDTIPVLIRIHQFLARRSAAIIVTNDSLAEIVQSWGGAPFVLEDPPIRRMVDKTSENHSGRRIFVVNTFSSDEPIREILEAAKKLPEVKFYLTGNKAKAPLNVTRDTSSNVFFTDFIPDDEYWKLLDSCDAVICLTTRDYTLVCGGYEAIYSGKPLITSNYPVLKNYYNFGTLHVDNTADSIAQAVRRIIERKELLVEEIRVGIGVMEENWKSKFKKFRELIEA
jgi:glycosyltransferase involved in cell wall biosynthesis